VAGCGTRSRQVGAAWRGGWEVLREKGPGQITFWFIALLVGIAAGFAALFFRKGIEALQQTLYGVDNIRMIHSFAESLPWFLILLIPVAGGLVVGLILHWFTPDGRVRSVADVIEGAALDNGRVEMKAGLASALASMITLGSGGSSGREGPVVHLAAVISTWVSERMNADGITGRDLLGCAVAAAVSASFNAPIAGALFALEVVLRHFAVHAFAPIVIASVGGDGDQPAGIRRHDRVQPAGGGRHAAVLRGTAGLPAPGARVGPDRGGLHARDLLGGGHGHLVQRLTGIPRWLRPAIAGLLLGASSRSGFRISSASATRRRAPR
jgi:CIC family chloride channel protein